MTLGRAVLLLLLGAVAAVLGPWPSPRLPDVRREPAPVVEPSEEFAIAPTVLGRHARGRAAHHTAVLTARLVATGTSREDAEAEAFRLLQPTGCGEHTRFFIVPRGFVDGQAIEDRISIEASFYRAEMSAVADSAIPANTRFAPQFSRIISAVFLFDCPAARA